MCFRISGEYNLDICNTAYSHMLLYVAECFSARQTTDGLVVCWIATFGVHVSTSKTATHTIS